MSIAIAAAALLAASLPGTYECDIERQAIVTEAGVQPGTAVEIGEADRGAWTFSVRVPRADGNAAFSILPARSSQDVRGVRSLLQVIFIGTCRPQGRAG